MAIALTIGLIVMVAALNIVASLVLLVMEKSRDIGILRTMGAPASAIRRIFLLQGLTIGAIGTGAGTLMGLLVCWVSEHYRFVHEAAGRRVPDHAPAVSRWCRWMSRSPSWPRRSSCAWSPTLCYPSRRKAASLDPAEALRYQ